MLKSLFIGISLVCASFFSIAQESRINLEESNLYTKIADVEITDFEGKSSYLSDIYKKSPLLIAPVFSKCAGICSPFLKNLSDNVTGFKEGQNFKILVISFDPKDKVSDMQLLAKRYDKLKDKQWIFATTSQIDSLNVSMGFKPIWNANKQQFEHEALLVGVNDNGFITRKLIGLRDAKTTLSLISELNDGFVMSYPLPRENMLFSCFTYNPATGKTSFSIGFLLMLLPAILTLLLIFWLATKKPKEM